MKILGRIAKTFGLVAVATLGFVSAANAEITTYPYQGWDAPGNDVESVLSGNSASCAQNCLERASCSAAVFNSRTARCWMKSAARGTVRSNIGTLHVKIVTGKTGVDYPGGDYRNFQASSWASCSRSCYLEAACKAFTFDTNTQTCWLKSAVVDASFVPHAISGKK